MRLCVLLHIGGPVDPIPEGLPAAEEDGEGPEPLVVAEYLLKVQRLAHIVGTPEGLALLIQVFNCCFVRCGQEDVEAQEHGHKDSHDACEDVADLDRHASHYLLFVAVTL
jgi:hypothetical protein